MSDLRTAAARLERLLHVLPAALREEGAALEELAEELETSPERLVEDIDELTARSFYQPGGWPDDVQILLEGGRVRVLRADGFERPVRLNRDETLCLALALRGAAAAAAHLADDEAREALLARAEAHLRVRIADEKDDGPDGLLTSAGGSDPEGIRETIIAAVEARRPCALWYVTPGAREGRVRVVHTYAVVYGEGAWYAVGHCTAEDGLRVFRLDRVLACDLADGSYEIPEDFRPEAHVDNGRVFHTRDGQDVRDVRVRYSPRVARWVRERAQWEPERIEVAEDGSLVLRHAVADPTWAVGHTLIYGAEAELLEPEEMRGLVRDAVRELAG